MKASELAKALGGVLEGKDVDLVACDGLEEARPGDLSFCKDPKHVKLVEQLRNPMLAAKAKADLEKQVGEIQQKLIAIEQRYRGEMSRCRQDLQDLEGRLLKTTTDDLRKRIAKFANEKDYDFVLDSNAIPFSKPDYNVTDAILKAMGVDPATAKGNEKNESK